MSKGMISQRVTFLNRTGNEVVAYHDYSQETLEAPFVIFPPGFGETKRDYISFSYYCVANGFQVLRYDNTFHLGESEGDIFDTNPKRMEVDLIAAIDWITRNRADAIKIAVVASSVASRIALRVARRDARIGFLVSLVGVVNLRRTFLSIYQEDIIGQYINGRRWGSLDILGHLVKDSFLDVVVNEGYDSLDRTKDDVQHLSIPVVFFTADKDVWVDVSDVEAVAGSADGKSRQLHHIRGGLHQIQENPRLAKEVICETVLYCMRYVGNSYGPRGVLEPSIRDIVAQNKLELKRSRELSPISRENERKFWESYLSKYSLLSQSTDFQEYLRVSVGLLGGLEPGDRILDAGSGNGLFGGWLLREAMESQAGQVSSCLNVRYVGLDITEAALRDGAHQQSKLIASLKGLSGNLAEKILFSHVIANLEEGLPFRSELFNKVCCNLVLSYLESPEQTMLELVRVLRPGGKLIVSSLKPYCDLSLIYHNYVLQTQTALEREDAKCLLSNTGQIRRKEREGHYHFYDQDELAEMFTKSGLHSVQVIRTLGNQVNIGIAQRE